MRHVLQGVGDFLQRYAAIFRAVWSDRKSLDSPSRTQDEIAFLPAHLELTETPVSPAARWTMRIIAAFFCIALLWACIGKVDVVAVAPGKTVVGSRTKVIQPLETAVVHRILVRDGQAVKQGDILVELDATATGADFRQADEALIAARLAQLRQTAMLQALDTGVLPGMPDDPGASASRVRAAWDLAASELAEYQARRQNLLAAIAQREAQANTVRSQIGPMEQSLAISRERVADLERLLGGQYVSRHEYLARQQEMVELERALAAQKATLLETRSALVGAREELRVLETDTRQQVFDNLRQAREQAGQYEPQVAKTRQRDELMQLRAPVDGTVQQLAIHTVGGVVTPAQALMAVVPNQESLEVEATVLNKDIGFVRPGQPVTLKVESFPYTRYGYLEGIVETVSHDAAQDEQLGLVFPARVRLQRADLMVDGVKVALTPGMSLSAEIKTGKRRLIDYVFSPLQKHGGEAFRER
ncbi:HlyD family type I secretion periplasmic adaptor subunit [Stenotrophomonas acidaminiphila]|uniref:HlyD family type I secretion periplasmic adaptor subunit n=1 Tax=Stenotrophomonas acidaminiphila TaxID=128780 RepID=UPI001375EA9D|nr:HlyD family type I secretion periplasmic adaptor subunit [Stenotrophomonas acidaminiphila]NCT87074.1 HlyD family type I secretion periplasmic adaptor subunit [Stenotrophomonas acidaminiphila]